MGCILIGPADVDLVSGMIGNANLPDLFIYGQEFPERRESRRSRASSQVAAEYCLSGFSPWLAIAGSPQGAREALDIAFWNLGAPTPSISDEERAYVRQNLEGILRHDVHPLQE